MPRKVTKNSETKNAAPRTRRGKNNGGPAVETAAAAPVPSISEERIRERAYELFRAGANPRDPVADWIQAERELIGESGA